MNKQQTAVEWFYDKIKSHFEHDGDLLETLMFTTAIAKQKEKEQITNATNNGCSSNMCYIDKPRDGEKYYNETYPDNPQFFTYYNRHNEPVTATQINKTTIKITNTNNPESPIRISYDNNNNNNNKTILSVDFMGGPMIHINDHLGKLYPQLEGHIVDKIETSNGVNITTTYYPPHVIQFGEFYEQSCEDWHLWDEQEQGPYPIHRILDAMKKFIDTQKITNNNS